MDSIIETLSFRNFRNLEEASVSLSPGINIFCGSNGMGKTNILESIFLCSTGRSHRTHKTSSLINFDEKSANVVLCLNNRGYKQKINISLRENEKKGIALNGVALKKTSELFGVLKTVMFSPEDMGLVNGGPNFRRRFMDMELCQQSKVYCHNLEQYFKVLKERNNLLKNGGNSVKDTLFVWDSQLVQYGKKIINYRKSFIEKIYPICSGFYNELTSGREKLEVIYKPEADENELEEKIKNSLQRDIYYKKTHCGPHRDDVIFKINGSDARGFGSQGQKKSVCLALKLSEVKLLKDETGEMPVLLLDDVLSELDTERQSFILKSLKDMQIILSCTGADSFIKNTAEKEKTKIFFLKNGKITVNN
ncbi:MAG: DNA replication/repair protein RecF [Clostridiales bacterium]|nr:DNA replication/repair protein RecF [Clostridiales bacterium]